MVTLKYFIPICLKHGATLCTLSSQEPTIHLVCGRNRELWEQPFQACTIDADCVKPDGWNSVISFVISKRLLPGLSFSDRWSRGTKTLGKRLLCAL